MSWRGIQRLILTLIACAMPGMCWAQANGPAPQKNRLEFRRISPLSGTIPDDQIPPGYERLRVDAQTGGQPTPSSALPLIVKKTPEADSRIIARAQLRISPPDNTKVPLAGKPFPPPRYCVILHLTPEGRGIFADMTRRLIEESGKSGAPPQLAIVFDGTVLSAPTVREVVDTERLEITGNFTHAQAQALIAILQPGTPPAPDRKP